MKATCDNCGKKTAVKDLRGIKDYCERVDTDGPEPDGECPHCGCLAYVKKTKLRDESRAAIELVNDLIVDVTTTRGTFSKAQSAHYIVWLLKKYGFKPAAIGACRK